MKKTYKRRYIKYKRGGSYKTVKHKLTDHAKIIAALAALYYIHKYYPILFNRRQSQSPQFLTHPNYPDYHDKKLPEPEKQVEKEGDDIYIAPVETLTHNKANPAIYNPNDDDK